MTRLYLAGKIEAGDWRHEVVPGLRGISRYDESEEWIDRQWQPTPTIFDGVDYIGPYFTGCDHACAHTPGNHGFLADPICGAHCPHEQVKKLCLEAIGRADIFFAYLGGEEVCTAYGTIAELGYAKASGVKVITAAAHHDPALWFAHRMADLALPVGSPKHALTAGLQRLGIVAKNPLVPTIRTFHEHSVWRREHGDLL